MFEANGYQIRSSTSSFYTFASWICYIITPLSASHFRLLLFLRRRLSFYRLRFPLFHLLVYMGTGQRNIPGVVGKQGTGPHTQQILGGWHSGLQMSDITRVCWAA